MILLFSSTLLVALALQCSKIVLGVSCWALCELLQYFLLKIIVGNIVKVGGYHNSLVLKEDMTRYLVMSLNLGIWNIKHDLYK